MAGAQLIVLESSSSGIAFLLSSHPGRNFSLKFSIGMIVTRDKQSDTDVRVIQLRLHGAY